MATIDAVEMLEGSIEEILEGSSQSELVELIDDLDLGEVFIDLDLVDRLEEAREVLLRNLKLLKRQRALFKTFNEVETQLIKVVDEKLDMKILQETPLFDLDIFLELDSARLQLIEDRDNIKSKLKFDDEDELEDKIQSDLSKFNKVRRKQKEVDIPIRDRPKAELVDGLFEFFSDKGTDQETLEKLANLTGALRISELDILRE